MPLLDDLEQLRGEAQAAFAALQTPEQLEAARIKFLGTRGLLKGLLSRMGEVPKAEKPVVGKRANEVGAEMTAQFEAAKARIPGAHGSAPAGTLAAASGGTPSAAAQSATGGAAASSYETLKAERREKLKQYNENPEILKRFGPHAAWGGRFEHTVPIAKLRALFEGQPPEQHGLENPIKKGVRLAGRVMLRRDQSKKLIFLTVQDQDAQIQVALWNQRLSEETLALLRETLDLWDIIGVDGELAFTQKGEPTLWATDARILSKCLAPPPDKFHGIHDKELRYRQRYLDLISNEGSRKTFILRSKAVSRIRRFLDERGFLEMETPVLQTIPGGASARPFETRLNALDMKMFMRIATEIALKKCLVGGLERVYELGRLFRNEGIDATHNPEFTTVEVYQAYGDLSDMMELTETLVSGLAQEFSGGTTVQWRGRPVNLGAPWKKVDYCAFLKEKAGVDLTQADAEAQLETKLKEKGKYEPGMSWVDKIDSVFGAYCEPFLQDACFVINQPVEMSPLCKAHPENPKLAHRFEAFVAGMEIANAYSELNDPLEQHKRLEAQAQATTKKEDVGQQIDFDFLNALEHAMPPAGGLGIGIDRVVMLLAGADSLRDVILFPLMRPESGGQPS